MRGTGLVAIVAFAPLIGLLCASAVRAGQASFAPRTDVVLGPSGCDPTTDCSAAPLGVALGDFDGDHNADIATANSFSGDVSVLLGDGQGSATFGTSLGAAAAPSAIAAGKIDADDALDLAVADEGAGAVSLFYGVGDGTFRPRVDLGVGMSPGSSTNLPSYVVLADLNGDGRLDIATANYLGDAVSVLLADAAGGFGAPAVIPIDGGPIALAAGDLTGDHRPELVASANDVAQIVVLTNKGDGTFTEGARLDVGDNPMGVVVADFDADGKNDVAVVNEIFDTVSVALGRGDGTFEAADEYDVGGSPQAIAASDLNGDGHLDLVTADNLGTFDLANSVSVLTGLGDGTFANAKSFEVGTGPTALAVADLNGDHKPDLVTANTDGDNVSILLNTAEGSFVCGGDCNGDGSVSVSELVTGVGIALGGDPTACPEIDADQSGSVDVSELVGAVGNSLTGCGQ
jgi:FG-GAP-like repeat